MKSIEKTLEYHELVMVKNDLADKKAYKLPKGYSFKFWQNSKDLDYWIDIHMQSGEFTAVAYADSIFEEYYHHFLGELPKRCFFIINENKEKVATATLTPADISGYSYIDWLAIKKEYQGKGLAKPLISKVLQVAKALGENKIMLRTQTHTWLAAKLYLDFGFEPYNIEKDFKGWQILKTITNHEKLKDIKPIQECKMYSKTAINIVKQLNKLHNNYNYEIWHKNGRHEVWVNQDEKFYTYLYYRNGKKLKQIDRKFLGFA